MVKFILKFKPKNFYKLKYHSKHKKNAYQAKNILVRLVIGKENFKFEKKFLQR